MSRIWVIAALLAVGSVARAQGDPAAPDDAAARALYQEGDQLYAEGRYEEAVAKFDQAFELSGRPALLFNLANAYERLGDYARAADALRRYLPDGAEEEKVALRKRIARLDARAAAAKAERESVERDRAELVELRGRTCPSCEVEPAPRASRLWSYVLLGTGTAAVTTGIAFGVVARGANSDAAGKCLEQDGVRLCGADAKGDLDRERRFSLLADVSVGVGLASAGAGLYLWWRARRTDEARERNARAVVPAVGRDWAGVTFAGTF